VEVCPVQLPGRENRTAERGFTSMPPLVEALAAALERWRDLPYAVFGHSNGAVLGFELARLARRRGTPGPVHLFASGRRAPDVAARQPEIHQLPDAEFLRQLAELGGMPRAILEHPELLELILPLLRGDLALAETYEFTPGPPLAIPISAYAGAVDAEVPVWQVEAWKEQTTGPFRLQTFPGGHFFLHDDRDRLLQELGRELRPHLARLAHAPRA
jgi:medium-chain acyl-[acyl-carrier-protein] hydrolase